MTTADLGDKKRVQTTFALSGTNTDPDAAVLIARKPNGTKESYLSGSGFNSQGNWDADGNSPTLANGTGTVGDHYTVTVAGSVDLGDGSQTFAVGDRVVYDGDAWLLIPSPQSATLTNSATGIYHYDYPFHQVGTYTFRFEGFGTVHAATETSVQVSTSKVR